MERIDEFASKFPCLNDLRYGYCKCGSSDKIPVEAYAQMVSRLPDLTGIKVDDYRNTMSYSYNEELEIIEAFYRKNNRLKSIGFKYFWTHGYGDVVWKAASLPTAEHPKNSKGQVSIWTPDPCKWERWIFWLNTFGVPSIVRPAMLERWPESSLPTLEDLESFSQAHLSTFDARIREYPSASYVAHMSPIGCS
ncbi:hypothetical protein CPB86DRAFT_391051 [Serendipita vermifera]|nr:hypothetical protein CPB86DRAFT_391051 [Serendipita vermifera]